MPDSPYAIRIKPGEPADYRIKIQGQLDESWSGRLGGRKIKIDSGEGKPVVTELTGRVAEQAQLIRVLNSLYELHLPNLSMEVVTKYIRTFELLQKSARIEFTQGFQEGRWTGLVDGVPKSIKRSGLSDSALRFAINMYGASP